MVDTVFLVGRLLFSLIFLYSAIGHLTRTTEMAEYARSKGIPMPRLATVAAGGVLLIGGASVLFGVWADLGALLLALFLVITATTMHSFWRANGSARAFEITQFYKDTGLAGACLITAALVWQAGDTMGYMLTGPLLR